MPTSKILFEVLLVLIILNNSNSANSVKKLIVIVLVVNKQLVLCAIRSLVIRYVIIIRRGLLIE